MAAAPGMAFPALAPVTLALAMNRLVMVTNHGLDCRIEIIFGSDVNRFAQDYAVVFTKTIVNYRGMFSGQQPTAPGKISRGCGVQAVTDKVRSVILANVIDVKVAVNLGAA